MFCTAGAKGTPFGRNSWQPRKIGNGNINRTLSSEAFIFVLIRMEIPHDLQGHGGFFYSCRVSSKS